MSETDRHSDTLDKMFSQARIIQRRDFLATGAAMMGMAYVGDAIAAPAAPAVTDKDREYMRQAIALMRKAGVVDKTGGPFGCVIVRDGEVLAAEGNSVLRDNDPSAHAAHGLSAAGAQ